MLRNSVTVVDKIFISLSLGAVFLGYYGFVFIIYQAAMLASSVIMSVIGPKILMKMKAGEFAENVQRRILLVSLCIVIAGSLLYPFADSVYRWGVVNYFKQYNDPVTYDLFLIIYFSAMVSFVSSIWDWLFISKSKETMTAKFSLYSLGLFLVGLLFVFLNEGGILSVAVFFLLIKVLLLGMQLAYFYCWGGICSR
jgi:O-antigen/teichoic acid export membrane protein